MIRRPPKSTRTETLIPYTTLSRSRLVPPMHFTWAPAERVTAAAFDPNSDPSAVRAEIDRLAELLMPVLHDWVRVNSLDAMRSEEHTSELQSLMRISYAVFCLQKTTYSRITVTPNPDTNKHLT